MTAPRSNELAEIVSNFELGGRLIDVATYGSGHINDTYLSRVNTDEGEVRYVHQWINHNIFKDPVKLMENVERVTGHIRKKVVASGGDPARRVLNLVPAKDGRSFYRDKGGNYWRTYRFIDGARTYDVVEDLKHVYNAARAFGEFQKQLSDLPAPPLHETIPNFHNTKWRFGQFLEALDKDVENRARLARPEIDFVLAREGDTAVLVDLIAEGKAVERPVHNDTKFNNVMIDDRTGEGICVIDLDTVMPGLVMYDFGDSIRLGANPAAEDEKDLSKVCMDLAMFDRLAGGYLSAALDFLTPVEIEHLAFSAKLMTFECGMRFLADFLSGDVYFKVHRPAHNLDRCRTQFKMVEDMEQKADQMEAIIDRYRRSGT